MDFREFSEAYNNYLMHSLSDLAEERRKREHGRQQKAFNKNRDYAELAKIIDEPSTRNWILSGQYPMDDTMREAIEILNGGYNFETKKRLINGLNWKKAPDSNRQNIPYANLKRR